MKKIHQIWNYICSLELPLSLLPSQFLHLTLFLRLRNEDKRDLGVFLFCEVYKKNFSVTIISHYDWHMTSLSNEIWTHVELMHISHHQQTLEIFAVSQKLHPKKKKKPKAYAVGIFDKKIWKIADLLFSYGNWDLVKECAIQFLFIASNKKEITSN